MPTFDSCTKCVGSPGIINARTLDCFQSIDDLATERSFDSQATWVIDVLRLSLLSLYNFHGYVYNQTLADDLSTGAGIKYLYCTMNTFLQIDEKCPSVPNQQIIFEYFAYFIFFTKLLIFIRHHDIQTPFVCSTDI